MHDNAQCRERVFITLEITPNTEIYKNFDFYTEDDEKKPYDDVTHANVELDGRFDFFRSTETNMRNLRICFDLVS